MNPENFLFQAFVYLLAAVVSVPIAQRLGLGSVLGYLIAGVLIGPYVLKLVNGGGSDVMHVAEFGVVMMLFLVGLELRPSLLWRLRGPILGTGGLQTLFTSLAVGALGLLVGLRFGPALAIGLIFSASSTAIALQTLGEKNLLQTTGGQTSFAVLLFQDLSVIPVLAILPLLASGAMSSQDNKAEGNPLARAGLVCVVVVCIVVGGRFLIPKIFRFLALTHLHEIFTAAALLLVVGIALAMEVVGLSPALGTFLAGVVLAESEYRHELESDIEPFKGLLLGLFFISVGASIDLSLIRSQPLLIGALVLGLLVVKFVVLYLIGALTRLEKSQNFIFAFALAQGGEFAFVLVSFAVQNHVFDANLGNILVATVALSMVVAPLLFTVNEKLIQPRFSSRLPERDSDAIDTKDNPVILVGVGRFGAVVSRLLNSQEIKTTVLDFDADQIELIRKIGFKVFYGDATRLELLESAGAARAKLMIIAIEDIDRSVQLAQMVQRHFPKLEILVRAKDREHAYRLINLGIKFIFRETLDSSLELSVTALRLLGFGGYEARRAARTFRAYDEKTVRELAAFAHLDQKDFIGEVRRRVHSLSDVFESERLGVLAQPDRGWDPPKPS
jgi:monovalent cation:proton antiporter-2 (CPA2) family protein